MHIQQVFDRIYPRSDDSARLSTELPSRRRAQLVHVRVSGREALQLAAQSQASRAVRHVETRTLLGHSQPLQSQVQVPQHDGVRGGEKVLRRVRREAQISALDWREGVRQVLLRRSLRRAHERLHRALC